MCNTTANGTKSQNSSSNDHGTSLSTTHVYLVIWCLHLLQPWADETLFGKGSGGLDSRPLVTADYAFLLPAIVATLISLSTLYTKESCNSLPHHVIVMALVCHVVDLVIRFRRLPAVWDHEIWGLLINLSFSVCFLPAILSCWSTSTQMVKAQDDFFRLSRLQLALFYAAATFWKLNSSFFNLQTSCGTILILELIGAYSWGEIPDGVVTILIAMAPHLTLLVEATIAAGMLYTSWAGLDNGSTITLYCRDATVLLATVFHLFIFIMPVNSAGGFSLECLTRLVLFFDSVEMDRVQQWSLRRNPWILAVISILTPTTPVAMRYMATSAPFDVGFAFACLLFVFHCLILAGHGGSGGTGMPTNRTRTWIAALMQSTVLVLTVTYTFLTPTLGLMQMSAPTMYANLRSYHGGNHYLVPTAILGEDILYGGGLVQVVNSTSWSVNLLLAYISSDDVFPKRVVNMLQPQIRRSNNDNYEHLPLQLFPMCIFNPHSREVLMEEYRASNAVNSPLLTPFIIPISTLRKALKEANEREESFVIEFSESLDPNPVTFVRIDSSEECNVILKDSNASGDCSSSRVAQRVLGPNEIGSWFWQPLVDKLLVPYPELVGMAEEICMS